MRCLVFVERKIDTIMRPLSLDRISTGPNIGALSQTRLMLIFASKNAHPESFYLTGFEGICVEADHATLTEAVISSAIPLDGELLIVGNGEATNLWCKLAIKLNIAVSLLNSTYDNLIEILEAMLSANRNISHIICSSELNLSTVRRIGRVVRRSRRSFVFDNSAYEISMENINEFGIDFLMTALDHNEESPVSLLLARRSKLVQTEGNARSVQHDIYALWQEVLGGRCSSLEPMPNE